MSFENMYKLNDDLFKIRRILNFGNEYFLVYKLTELDISISKGQTIQDFKVELAKIFEGVEWPTKLFSQKINPYDEISDIVEIGEYNKEVLDIIAKFCDNNKCILIRIVNNITRLSTFI